MEQRYIVLRAYVLLLKVSAVLILVGSIVLVISSLVAPIASSAPAAPPSGGIYGEVTGALTSLVVLSSWGIAALGVVGSIGAWALADFLQAHMDTEANTREITRLVRQMVERTDGSSAASPPVGYKYRRAEYDFPVTEPAPIDKYIKYRK